MATMLDAVIRLKDNFSETIKRVEKNVGDFSKTYKRVGRDIQRTGRTISGIGKTLTTSVTLPIVGAGVAATKSAIDFESAFAGVRKTVDATENQFAELEKGIRDMAKEIPATAEEIAGVAEAAGQLGIQTENILEFTRTMIDLGEATNLTAEEASSSLAKFANITGMSQQEFDKLGSTIVDLGNNLATTEADIVAMGQRLAGAGSQVGLTEAQIMSFAAALSSVGIEAEAGGSAFSKVMVNMQLAVETGNETLEQFAKVAGMTSSEFSKAFKKDASGAMISFIKGLGNTENQGQSAIKVLDDMGISEVRMRDALLRAAGASDVFQNAINIGTDAWNENIALANEAAQRYETTASQIEIAKNKVKDLGIEIGQNLLPYVIQGIDKLSSFIETIQNMDDGTKETIKSVLKYAVTIGPLLLIIGKMTTGIGRLTLEFGFFAARVKKIGLMGAVFTPGAKVFLILTAIAAVIILLIKNWDKVKAKVNEVFPNAGKTIAKWSVYVKNILQALGKVLSVVMVPVKIAFFTAWEIIKNIFIVAVETIGGTISGLLQAISGIIDFITGVFTGNWELAWQGVTNIFEGVFGAIETIAKGIMNGAIGVINGAISGLNKIKIPDWVPSWLGGGKGINIPLIPKLAKGTDYWKGGIVQVHEKGGEIIDLPRGSRVYPHDKSVQMAKEQGRSEGSKVNNINIPKLADTIVIREDADIDKIANAIVRKIEKASLNMA